MPPAWWPPPRSTSTGCPRPSTTRSPAGRPLAGRGRLAFQNLQQAWHEKQTTIVAALNDFEQSLIVTDRDFTSTDDTQAQAPA